jgi:long-chain acyl-CoA synthetase
VANGRDTAALVRLLARTRFTVITGVNTLFNALLGHPDFPSIDCSRLKVALAGGMALQAAVADRWQRATGRMLIEAYGLTEAAPAVTINPLDLSAFNGSIGLPLPSTVLTIRDDAGNDLPPGRLGELCVHGPQVMQGYWRQPEETINVFWHDDFLRTGDIGMMDEHGFFRLLDRKKDVIVVSGFNVYPNEVEAVARSHPGVEEVAAVALPSEHSGEVVKLVVVRRDTTLTEAELQAFCRAELAPYKVPQQIEFCNRLPCNAVGKILRRHLREGVPLV